MQFERQDYQHHVGYYRLYDGRLDKLEAIVKACPPRLKVSDFMEQPDGSVVFRFDFVAWRKSHNDIHRLVRDGRDKIDGTTAAQGEIKQFYTVPVDDYEPRFYPRDEEAYAARDALALDDRGWLTADEVKGVKRAAENIVVDKTVTTIDLSQTAEWTLQRLPLLRELLCALWRADPTDLPDDVQAAVAALRADPREG